MNTQNFLNEVKDITLEILDEYLVEEEVISKNELKKEIANELNSSIEDVFKLEIGAELFPDIDCSEVFYNFDLTKVLFNPELDKAHEILIQQNVELHNKALEKLNNKDQ